MSLGLLQIVILCFAIHFNLSLDNDIIRNSFSNFGFWSLEDFLFECLQAFYLVLKISQLSFLLCLLFCESELLKLFRSHVLRSLFFRAEETFTEDFLVRDESSLVVDSFLVLCEPVPSDGFFFTLDLPGDQIVKVVLWPLVKKLWQDL